MAEKSISVNKIEFVEIEKVDVIKLALLHIGMAGILLSIASLCHGIITQEFIPIRYLMAYFMLAFCVSVLIFFAPFYEYSEYRDIEMRFKK